MANLLVTVIRYLVFIGLVTAYQYVNRDYRFDYAYIDEADGWLKYHPVPATWAEARLQCHAEGAVLASPLNQQLKKAIISFVNNETNMNNEQEVAIFSGIHATFSKGVYNSIEGVPLLRMAITWAPNEPDNFENSESCLAMVVTNNGSMADVRCDGVMPYVCYKPYQALAVNECGTIDHEYVLEQTTGSCYKYHTKILSWSDAFRTCEAEGGYLAIINSKAEAELIKSILHRTSSTNFKSKYPSENYIGYRDWGYSHNFMTIHGQSLNQAGYQKWTDGQPNNLSIAETNDHGQLCGGVSNNGQLNNLYCNLPFAFICEMTPNSLR